MSYWPNVDFARHIQLEHRGRILAVISRVLTTVTHDRTLQCRVSLLMAGFLLLAGLPTREKVCLPNSDRDLRTGREEGQIEFLVEVTPFVFEDRLYRLENWQKQWNSPDHLRIVTSRRIRFKSAI